MSSILDFIKTGTLNFIDIGTSRRCIDEKLGVPDDISVSKTLY